MKSCQQTGFVCHAAISKRCCTFDFNLFDEQNFLISVFTL